MEGGGEMGHLRFLGREELRWQRRGVIIVGGYLFLIQEWVIVRRPVLLCVRGCGKGRTTRSTGREIRVTGRTITRTV